MSKYLYEGKIYTEDEIRKAIRADLAEINIAIENAGGEPQPPPDAEDYLTESVHTGTIEVVADDDM